MPLSFLATTNPSASDCSPERARGIDGLGDRPGAGHKRRSTESERSTLVALGALLPPGRLVLPPDGSPGPQDEPHEEEPAHGTLNALTEAARACGIQIRRSQVRRMLLAEGVPVARDPLVGQEHRSPLRPKRTAVVALYTEPPGTTTGTDELGPVTPRLHPPPPGWSPDGHRSKAPLEDSRGEDKVWFYGALGVGAGPALTLTAPARNTAGSFPPPAGDRPGHPDG